MTSETTRERPFSAPRFLPAGLADPWRSLKQPLLQGCSDLVTYARVTAARRRHRRAGDLDAALREAARLVTSVQFARERLSTYRRIERLMQRHHDRLGSHLPDASMPESLVLFVGQSRSGHSLVGSLIDAHPDAVIAHEIHALKHLLAGADINELIRAIRLNAHLFDLLGRAYTGYDYAVPGQWQGRCRRLTVIGDKKGNGTTRLLRRHGRRLHDIEAALPMPLRFINVIRSPLDNIATKAARTGVSLPEAARRFFANAETLDQLIRSRPDQVKTLYLDELIAQPRDVIADLTGWLGLSSEAPGYIDAAASTVFERPKRTRAEAAWPPGLVDGIRRKLVRYPSLARFANEGI